MKSLLRLFSGQRAKDDGADANAKSAECIRQGNELEDRGEIGAALALYQRAVELTPQVGDAHYNYANALSSLGRTAAAVDAYGRALELDPGNANAHLNLGATHLRSGNTTAAEASYRQTVALRPQSANAWTGLGCALEMKPDEVEAVACFQKALAIDPGHEGAASRLAQILRSRGEARAAIRILDDVLAAKADSVLALRTRASLHGNAGNYAEGIADYRRVVAIAGLDLNAWSNLLWTLNFLPDITAEAVLAEHVRFRELLQAAVGETGGPGKVPARSRLKVGYVSADFRRHSVSCFIETLLKHHDRERFEVHCFYDYAQGDDVTARIAALAEHWHDIAGAPDEAVAQQIRNCGIDILVDLAGHTAHNRMRLFAMKPAPVQFTWLGYLCTTGLKAMDYRICDSRTDPAGLAERWQVEIPARLPDSQWCYAPQVPLPEPSSLPWRRNGYWTFGSFNQESKLNEPTLDAWGRTLASLPGSRLRIVGVTCDIVEERIRRSLGAHGIGRDRVELIGRVSIDDYFLHLRDVDVALDTFPYNGATTTCDALIMGVPVASIVGERSIARGGLSLLTTIGLPDWVVSDAGALPQMLSEHLRSPERIEELRTHLRDRIRQSPLMDGARFARAMEELFTTAWRERA